MTAALRMPDPFNPGAINPTAATPTCCCCCCCCLTSAVVTPVALVTSLARQTAPPRQPFVWGPPPASTPPAAEPAADLPYPAYPVAPASWVQYPTGQVGPRPVPSGRRAGGLVGVALSWVALLVGAVLVARADLLDDRTWFLVIGALVLLAAVAATGFAQLAGSRRSWTSGAGLVLGAVVFAVEFFLSAMILLTTGPFYFVFAALALAGGLWLVLRTGRGR